MIRNKLFNNLSKLKNILESNKKKNLSIKKIPKEIEQILKKHISNKDIENIKPHKAIKYFKQLIIKLFIDKLLDFIEKHEIIFKKDYRKIEKLLKTMLLYLQIYYRLYKKSLIYRKNIKKKFNWLLRFYKVNKKKKIIPVKTDQLPPHQSPHLPIHPPQSPKPPAQPHQSPHLPIPPPQSQKPPAQPQQLPEALPRAPQLPKSLLKLPQLPQYTPHTFFTLRNNSMGNSCYFNTFIQFLWRIDIIRDFLIIQFDNKKNLLDETNIYEINIKTYFSRLSKIFKDINSELLTSKEEFITINLKTCDCQNWGELYDIGGAKEQLGWNKNGEQQDIMVNINFLNTCFTQIDVDNLNFNTTYSDQINLINNNLAIKDTLYFKCNKEDTEIKNDIFKYELIKMINIFQINDDKITIQEYMNNTKQYESKTDLKADEEHICVLKKKLKKDQSIYSGYSKFSSFNYNFQLIIGINRFISFYIYDKEDRTKFESIKGKIKSKCIIDPTISFDNKNYYLKGCVVHQGKSIISGHYYYVEYNNGRPYCKISDSSFIKYDRNNYREEIDIINHNCVLCLYNRIDT